MDVSSTLAQAATAPTLGGEAALAQALASRICHDLVSPVGAVVNGMDLLGEMAGMPASEEIQLISQSARRASTVLAFHRLAFGAAHTDSAQLARPALATSLRDMLESTRVQVDVLGEEGPALRRPVARAIALGALCARGLLGMGGRVMVRLDRSAPLPIRITAEGLDRERKAPFIEMLTTPVAGETAPDPRTLEFQMIHGTVTAAGAVLSFELSDDTGTLRLERA